MPCSFLRKKVYLEGSFPTITCSIWYVVRPKLAKSYIVQRDAFSRFSMYVVGKYHPVLFCHRRLIQQYTYTSSCIIFQAFYYTRNEKMWYFHEILFHVFILVNLVTIKAISASNNEEELHLWKETMQELEKFRQIVNNLAINQKEVRQSANDHTIGKKHALNR